MLPLLPPPQQVDEHGLLLLAGGTIVSNKIPHFTDVEIVVAHATDATDQVHFIYVLLYVKLEE